MRTTKDLGAVAVTQHTPTNHSANYTSIETIEQALSFIPADDRDTWIECGMAIKAELGDEVLAVAHRVGQHVLRPEKKGGVNHG